MGEDEGGKASRLINVTTLIWTDTRFSSQLAWLYLEKSIFVLKFDSHKQTFAAIAQVEGMKNNNAVIIILLMTLIL